MLHIQASGLRPVNGAILVIANSEFAKLNRGAACRFALMQGAISRGFDSLHLLLPALWEDDSGQSESLLPPCAGVLDSADGLIVQRVIEEFDAIRSG